MTQHKSPFWIYPNLISPKICEQIVDKMDLFTPDVDQDGYPLPVIRHDDRSEEQIFDHLEPLLPNILEYYQSADYTGTERVTFEFYGEGTQGKPHCENSSYINRIWSRTTNRDFSCVLFLSNYNNEPPFDDEYEVYGGKLEFPQHNFGFNPTRGTLIVFPSGPHFINAVSPVIAGELFLARFHISTALPYNYNPNNFPGDYRAWFRGM